MNKRGVISLLSLILLISIFSVNAQNNVELTLKDSQNQVLTNVIVYLELGESTTQHIVFDTLKLDLPNGRRNLVLKVDDPFTEGMDFFKTIEIDVSGNVTKDITLTSAGSLRGLVKDKLDNVIPNAELKFECIDKVGEFPAMTDKFGSFSIDYMPTCSCKIFAKYRRSVGFKELQLSQGDLEDVDINLDTSIVPSNYGFIFLIIILVIVVIVIFKFRKHILPKKKEKIEKKSKSKRINDIMPTLKTKEKEIVDYILKHNNESSQANIRHATGIPRTSLSRILESLKSKKIVNVEKHGKAVKIKLTNWFLEKE